MDDAVYSSGETYARCKSLSSLDIAFLKKIQRQIPIVADVCRSDVLVCGLVGGKRYVVVDHLYPHSVSAAHRRPLTGTQIEVPYSRLQLVDLLRPLQPQWQATVPGGAVIVSRVYPIYRAGQNQVIGCLRIDTNLLEFERHRRRSRVFRRVVRQLIRMAQYGQVTGSEQLSPFYESDGILLVDYERVIRYVSGVGIHHYSRMGRMSGLLGRSIRDLGTADNVLVRTALRQERCVEKEEDFRDRYWIKKAIPVLGFPVPEWLRWFGLKSTTQKPTHVILLARDLTDTRRQEQELRVKTALVQEVHHRVKNNLQSIAALLRLQARRVESEEARQAIQESVSRILSTAIIHEFLSNDDAGVINIKDVTNRIITQMRQGILDPEKHIRFEVEGPVIYLPARQATACALIINELLQNSLEHGFNDVDVGLVRLVLQDEGDHIVVRVHDDGGGLPANFRIQDSESLGLQIVQTLVREDLKGTIEMRNGKGAETVVTFPKSILGGE